MLGTYYFQRNLQGDVVAIYNTNGAKVGGYAYDAYGNCTVTLNTNGIAAINPIRYRGYYYDQDTGLYCLGARYYSPVWRRFISPDDTAYLDPENPNGLNLYAYCYNDPVNYVDPSGHMAMTTFGLGAIIAIVSAAIVIGGGTQIASNALAGQKGSEVWRGVAGSALGSGINALCLCWMPLTGGALWAVSALLAAGVQTGVDTIEAYVRGESISLGQTSIDFGINAATTFAGNWLGAKLIPTKFSMVQTSKFRECVSKTIWPVHFATNNNRCRYFCPR